MSDSIYEKLGLFYLGKRHDLPSGKTLDELVLYESKDLTTHAVCVGMTGSGKTGLCLALLEEAAIDGIPVIAIDPKGDLANLLLTFPRLSPADFLPWIDPAEATRKGLSMQACAEGVAALWKKGLADWDQDGDRIARLRAASEFTIYTPGSTAGRQLNLIQSFAAPPAALQGDPDALQERIRAAVSGLLALVGISADPLQSREHILLSNILHNAWQGGRDLELAGLIREIQNPPFDHLGVFDLETVFPQKDRMALSLSLNALLASPGFAAWMQGEPLDVARLLGTDQGRPRVAIMSIAHLSEAERMFFVTVLLNELTAWMRTQQGTSSLRAILYMDEIFGYFPPTANPPAKQPMLTLLKQARAYGLGVVLATQNPVDLDYKGLSNTGTWFIGRLQTERDKQRVLDGLEGASTATGAGFDRAEMERTLASLGNRIFLMHNVHDREHVIFQTRWAMSYLRGPLTRPQIQSLMAVAAPAQPSAPTLQPAARPAPAAPAAPAPVATTPGATRPPLPPEAAESFLRQARRPAPGSRLVYQPRLAAAVKLHYALASAQTDCWITTSYLAGFSGKGDTVDWASAAEYMGTALEREPEPSEGAAFGALPSGATNGRAYAAWQKEFTTWLYQNRWMTVWSCPELKEVSKPGESEGDFRNRLRHAGNERRDLAMEQLRSQYGRKFEILKERIRKAEQKVEIQDSQLKQQTLSTAVSVGATLLGAIFGRKSSVVTGAGSSVRRAGSVARERGDVIRAKADLETQKARLAELETEFEEAANALKTASDVATLQVIPIEIKPRKTDLFVSDFGLVWVPVGIDASGVTTPLH